jgi:dihydroorotate dehydrogenase (fumarate)
MHSLFEEQITLAESGRIHHRDPLDVEFAAALAPFQPSADYRYAPQEYLEYLQKVKQAVAIPVIASLNGTTQESWLHYAGLMQEAGADALEVNYYEVVTELDTPGTAIETRLRDIVLELKRALRIPVAVKLSPFFTAFGNVARQLDGAGADGLVIFNRFYQPDIDVRHMTATTTLELSRSSELLLRLRWLALLYGRVRASLAVTGGIESANDGIKAILAGAHAVQSVSAVLRHGPGFIRTLKDGLGRWMEWQKIEALDEMRGRVSLAGSPDPLVFERANYIRALHHWN